MVRHSTPRMTAALSMAFCILCLGQAMHAQATAFSYQGKLRGGGLPATGQFDFVFKLLTCRRAVRRSAAMSRVTMCR